MQATITVKNAETQGPLGGVEVELVGLAKQQTGTDGIATFDVQEALAYDLKVRHDALRPTYKEAGDYWLTEVVDTLPDGQRGRFERVPGQAAVWGIVFSSTDTNYDVLMRRQLRHAGAVSATPGGKVVFDQAALEVVIVVGTNKHSNTYGNKMMFLAQAVLAIRSRYSKEAYLSLLMFTDVYSADEVAEVKRRALGYNGNAVVVTLASKQELVNYLNTRSADGSYDYRANERILIKEMRIFSHGLPSQLAFGMDLPDPRPGDLSFVIADVPGLKAEAWNPGAKLLSFACRTGNTSGSELFGDDWKTVATPEASLAQKLAEQLGITVYGFITRSDYQPTWGDEGKDPDYTHDYDDITDPSVSSGIKEAFRGTSGKVRWNHRGAFLEPKSGDTPHGLNEHGAGGLWVFEKGKAPVQSNSSF